MQDNNIDWPVCPNCGEDDAILRALVPWRGHGGKLVSLEWELCCEWCADMYEGQGYHVEETPAVRFFALLLLLSAVVLGG